jgi:UDP-N-acetylmuramoyl-tripeptide--D-alanyl-D-alanine ligase
MAGRTSARLVAFGVEQPADVRAEGVTLDAAARPSFRLVTAAGPPADVTLALHGAHHVGNALAAAAVGLEAGLSPPRVAAALAAAAPASRWRMEVGTRPDGVTIVNDAYNANPESVQAALRAVAAMAGGRAGRAVAVLGEMLELGDGSVAEHRAAGELAADLGFEVVAVGEGAYPAAAAAGPRGHAVPDAAAAETLLATLVEPGDVVLVKASRGIGLEALAARLEATGADDALTLGTVAEDGAPTR